MSSMYVAIYLVISVHDTKNQQLGALTVINFSTHAQTAFISSVSLTAIHNKLKVEAAKTNVTNLQTHNKK